MGALEAVGSNRTYACFGQREFNFANWAKAVRQGNTFMTTGPLSLFQVDGHTQNPERYARILDFHREARERLQATLRKQGGRAGL